MPGTSSSTWPISVCVRVCLPGSLIGLVLSLKVLHNSTSFRYELDCEMLFYCCTTAFVVLATALQCPALKVHTATCAAALGLPNLNYH